MAAHRPGHAGADDEHLEALGHLEGLVVEELGLAQLGGGEGAVLRRAPARPSPRRACWTSMSSEGSGMATGGRPSTPGWPRGRRRGPPAGGGGSRPPVSLSPMPAWPAGRVGRLQPVASRRSAAPAPSATSGCWRRDRLGELPLVSCAQCHRVRHQTPRVSNLDPKILGYRDERRCSASRSSGAAVDGRFGRGRWSRWGPDAEDRNLHVAGRRAELPPTKRTET